MAIGLRRKGHANSRAELDGWESWKMSQTRALKNMKEVGEGKEGMKR